MNKLAFVPCGTERMIINMVKQKIKIYFVTLIVGILLIFAGMHTENALGSIGFAVAVISAVRIVRYKRLMKNPAELEKYENALNDERTAYIASKAYSAAYWVSVYCLVILMCVFLFLKLDEYAKILSYITTFQLLLYVLFAVVYNKKY